MASMTVDPLFDIQNLAKIEPLLLAHPIARKYFQGELYDGHGQRLRTLVIDRLPEASLILDEATIGRVFMAPDGSIVKARHICARNDAPAGLNIQSSSVLHATGENSSVIAFREAVGPALWIDALHIDNLILAPQAPMRLATIAFGLMTIAAYRLGFQHISLYAAGRGPLRNDDPDAMIGYAVWPKFGFDAPVFPVELNRFPHPALARASTVQDVLNAVPGWWTEHGRGRTMLFDLKSGSRSWSILLNYLYAALLEDGP